MYVLQHTYIIIYVIHYIIHSTIYNILILYSSIYNILQHINLTKSVQMCAPLCGMCVHAYMYVCVVCVVCVCVRTCVCVHANMVVCACEHGVCMRTWCTVCVAHTNEHNRPTLSTNIAFRVAAYCNVESEPNPNPT